MKKTLEKCQNQTTNLPSLVIRMLGKMEELKESFSVEGTRDVEFGDSRRRNFCKFRESGK